MDDKFSAAGLDQIKVGDMVAPIRTTHSRLLGKVTTTWTGTLLRVTKVTDKRFCVGGNQWVAKDTGYSTARGGGCYALATKDMLAEVEHKKQTQLAVNQKVAAFEARPDYQHACHIQFILDEMTPDNHPLDRLTVDEWAALSSKLSGREPK